METMHSGNDFGMAMYVEHIVCGRQCVRGAA